MKTTSRLLWLVCGMMMLLAASCSKDNDTVARELLATVPSNASVVALIDGEQMAEKGGGDEQMPSLLNYLASTFKNGDSAKVKNMLTTLVKHWDPTAAVVFMDGQNVYLTTPVSDPSALAEAVAKQSGAQLSADGDMKYNGSIAIIGNQVWVSLGNGSIQPTAIKNYSKYADNQSFAGVEYCDHMVDSDKDINALVNVSALMSMATGANSFGSQLVLSTLFDNASYLGFEADFGKGEADFEAKVLTSKFKEAKFLLPVSKIDTKTVASAAPSAGVLMAVNIDSKLVSKIKDIATGLGGQIPSDWLAMIDPIDGTIAIATEADSDNLSGVITTNGGSTVALSQLLSEYKFTVTTQPDRLLFTQGTGVKGSIDMAKASGYFNGAWAGVVATPVAGNGAPSLKESYIMLTPNGSSLALKGKAIFADAKKNALQQIR